MKRNAESHILVVTPIPVLQPGTCRCRHFGKWLVTVSWITVFQDAEGDILVVLVASSFEQSQSQSQPNVLHRVQMCVCVRACACTP